MKDKLLVNSTVPPVAASYQITVRPAGTIAVKLGICAPAQIVAVAGLIAGAAIGGQLQSGLVGAGGGFISVPFMVAHNISIINAVATSAALGFPIALANTVGYVFSGASLTGLPPHSLGYVWLPALGVIACCSVLTAPLGAKMAHRLPVAKLKRVFAVILYGLAGYMLWKGLHG